MSLGCRTHELRRAMASNRARVVWSITVISTILNAENSLRGQNISVQYNEGLRF